MLDFRNYELN